MGKLKPKKVNAKCLTCDNKAQSRGLCWRCHAHAIRSIRSETVTEKELIERGLLLPAKTRGRQANSGFANALAKLLSRPKRKTT